MAKSELPIRGQFHVEHLRTGKVIGTHDFPNGITVEGKNRLLSNMFNNGNAVSTWYLGLIDANSATVNDTNDNYNSAKSGGAWNEYNGYNVGGNSTIRGTWGANTASNKTITNQNPVVFDINTGSNQVIYGIMVCGGGTTANAQVKGNSSNDPNACLWSTANFTAGNVTVQNGDQLKVTYTVST